MSKNLLEPKIILITGATSGIGLNIAQHFAKLGHTVIGCGLIGSAAEGEKIVTNLKELGAKEAHLLEIDVSAPEEIKKMFSSLKDKDLLPNILINNAGIQFVSPIVDFPEEKWERIIRINLIASFYTIKYSLPYMISEGWGRIINIASAHALVASPFKSAYVAAKHGIAGLTKSASLEVAEKGITVNSICPGYVKTPLVLGQVKDTAKARGISEEDVINKIMLGPQATKRFVELDEISGIVEFLCTPAASSITGSMISMDGGWTAQ